MPYVPISLPSANKIDRFGSETTPRTPFVTGIAIDLQDSMLHTWSGVAGYTIKKWFDEKYAPGDFLTAEQVKEKYPNISAPNGEYESIARLKSERRAYSDFSKEVVDNMDKNFFTYAGRMGQFVLAQASDPLQGYGGTLIAKGFGALVARLPGLLQKAIPALSKIAFSPLAKSLTEKGLGAVEGMTQMAPYVALQKYEGDEQLEEEITTLGAIQNLAVGGILGAAFRTVHGYKPLVPRETVEAAMAAAKAQVESGKAVDIDLILKDGLYNTVKNEELTAEEILKRRSFLEQDNIRLTERLAEKEKDVLSKLEKMPEEEAEAIKSMNKHERLNSFLKTLKNIPETETYKFLGKVFNKEELKTKFEAVKELHKEVNPLREAKTAVEDVISDTDAYLKLLESNEGEVTPIELSDKMEKINSWRGGDTVYLDEFNLKNKIVEETPPTFESELEELESEINQRREAGELTEDEEASIRELDIEDKKIPRLKEAALKAVRCILGSGEVK